MLQESESEPQPVIRSQLSQPHPLGSDRAGNYERSFQIPNLCHLNMTSYVVHKLFLWTAYKLKMERKSRAAHLEYEEYNLLK